MNPMPPSPWEPLPEEPAVQPEPESELSPRQEIKTIILHGVGLGLLVSLCLILLTTGTGLAVYAYYAASLPSPEELHERTTPFKSTKIYDRHGRLLFEVFDPLGGRRTIVHLDDIPSTVIEATIATEDGTFYSNPGLNPLSIARAFYEDLRAGEFVQGGSTITQQLVKNLFLTRERTLTRKAKEAILAAEITRRYTKDEILEVYLNEVYFGNLAYGLGAAAESYFGKRASKLNLSEAALLAGLIQSPALYDPYTYPKAALARRATVLHLMADKGYITRREVEEAVAQPLGIIPQTITMEAPHWVMYLREQLEARYGTEMLYRGGLQVYTTLDLDLQHLAEEIAREKIAQLRERKASNAALVALDPATGDVLAMLGSVDFHDQEIDGQVNVTRRLRQPGSTIKPFTYLAALERGWTASTMLMDVAQEFPDGVNPPYKPHNYDGKEWGAVSLRTALACSRNIPTVSTLYQIGLPALLEVTQRLGIHSLNRDDYGLSLTLGGGDVTLLEMTGAYAALAAGGHIVTPRTILYITDQEGQLIMPETTPEQPLVMDPRHAYLLSDILADDEARIPAFGRNSSLKLSFPAAVKTGTTDDYRDSWTIGYTPDLVTGVWVGNNDNSPMKKLSGSQGAGIIWHDFMERALATRPHPGFGYPDDLVEVQVCPISGQKHTEFCPPARVELFLVENTPQECSLHKRLRICKITAKLATEFCPEDSVEDKVYEDYGSEWDEWARGRGLEIPPRETCPLHTSPTNVSIQVPSGPLAGIVQVRGSTEMADFAHYVVEYGIGHNPQGWKRISPQIMASVHESVIYRWDTRRLRNGTYSLRIVVSDHHGHSVRATAFAEIRNPTATPSVTLTLTAEPSATPSPTETRLPTRVIPPTPTATSTLEPTRLPTVSATPSRTAKPRRTPRPSATARPTSTPQPSATATHEPSPSATIVPSDTPLPSPTLSPSPTTAPSDTPRPSPTVQPTLTPEPTATPQPSDTPTPLPAASATPSSTSLVETATPAPPEMTPTPSPSATAQPSVSPSPTKDLPKDTPTPEAYP